MLPNRPHNFDEPDPAPFAHPGGGVVADQADRWVNEQMFEEDVRAVLRMMRPHGRERLQGWREYRTGGSHFRVTISWDDEFEISESGQAIVCAEYDGCAGNAARRIDQGSGRSHPR